MPGWAKVRSFRRTCRDIAQREGEDGGGDLTCSAGPNREFCRSSAPAGDALIRSRAPAAWAVALQAA